MRFGSKEYLNRCVDFFIKQAIMARNPQQTCDYYPINVHVDLTDDCNLNCIHCHDHKAIKYYDRITWKTYKKAIGQIKEIGSGVTIGNKGEPFLHLQAARMIAYAKKAGLFTNVITNVTVLTQKSIDILVDAKVDRLVLSLDSAIPEIYEKSRLGGKFKKTFINVMHLLKANFEKGSPVFINVSCVAHKIVIDTMDETRRYFSRFPVDNFFVSPLHSQFGLTQVEDQTIFISKKKNTVKFKEHPICMSGFNRMFIYPNGDVGLCDNEVFGHYIIGNVNKSTLRKMWNNKLAMNYRRALIRRDYSLIEKNGKLCSICDFKWIQNTQNYLGSIVRLLAEEIATNDEFKRDLSKRHARQSYEAVLKELKRLEELDKCQI